MKRFALIGLVLSTFFSTSLFAQPSATQVKKDLSKPGVLSVKLLTPTGRKSWSSAWSQYFWEHSAVIYRSANLKQYPNAKIRIGGFARYTIAGGTYTYREFKVTYNEYEGIPSPSSDDILALVNDNLKSFLGSSQYNSIVSDVSDLQLDPEQPVTWHTPNSFTAYFTCAYKRVVSYTEVADIQAKYETRFYRDAVESPWKTQFVSSLRNEVQGAKEVFTAEEIRQMPSLGSMEAEMKAEEALMGLPDIEIPSFTSDIDAFLFIHGTLLEGDPKRFEAMMMKMMAPGNFIEGSSILLNQRGADMINQNIKKAFGGKSTYPDQYCADPSIKHRQTNMIEFLNKSKQVHTRIALGKFGGRFVRGERVDQEYKITALSVGVLTRQVDLDYMNSWPDDELCDLPEQSGGNQQSASVAPALNWKGYKSLSSGIRVSLPAKPEESAEPANGGKQYRLSCQHSSGIYQIASLPIGAYPAAKRTQI
ncbi:MAG: hypothetical protein AAF206_04675, partial [Bacteroidota bacterium]